MTLSDKDWASIRARVEQCHLSDADLDEVRRLLFPPRLYVEMPDDSPTRDDAPGSKAEGVARRPGNALGANERTRKGGRVDDERRT